MSAPIRRGQTIDPAQDADPSARLNIVILDDDKSIAPHAKFDASLPRGFDLPREDPEIVAPDDAQVANSNLKPGWAGLKRSRRFVVVSLAGLVALAATAFAYHYVTVGRFLITTDDAYIRAHNTTLATKVSGYVARVHVEDNTQVRDGDLIATIDDGDYRIAVTAARDKVATQQATVERIERQVQAQHANVAQARAQLAGSQAIARRASQDLHRQRALNEGGNISAQALERAQSNYDQAIASVQHASAVIEAALANVEVLKAQQEEAARLLKELRTMQGRAERDLSFSIIRAPIDGVVSNRAVQVGDFVAVGQRIASIVPLHDVYVVANFKETQLAGILSGQPATIKIDALRGKAVDGTVISVSPASAAVFSLLPPDNATGNFTKIVQRVPVRIRVPANIAAERSLRPGMSVVVSVNTKPDITSANALVRPVLAGEVQLKAR